MVYEDRNQLSRADLLERYYLGEELQDEKKEEEEPAVVFETKLVVELKSPKSVGVGGETTSASSVKEEQQHYCYSCERGFNSGKALGGHMSSAHVQASRDYQSKKRLKCGSSDVGDEDGAGGVKAIEYVCSICEKVFPTEKSLHGHMRSHPDRPYRGMNPPPQKKTRRHQSPKLEEKGVSKDPSSSSSSVDGGSSSSSPSDHDHNEEDKSLDDVQPSVRRIINPPDSPAADASEIPKSGKLSSFSSSGADDQSSSVPRTADEELSHLVNSFERLSNTDEIKVGICTCDPNPVPFDGDQTPPPRDLVRSIVEVYERNPSNVNIPAADSDESKSFKNVKISIVGESERKLEESPRAQGMAPLITEPNNNQNNSPRNSSVEDNEKTPPPGPVLENQDQTYFEPRNGGSRKRIGIQKKGEGEVLSGAEKGKKTYECRNCNRVFSTHQALGGHMSSHNKISSSSTTTRFTLLNNNNAATDNNPSSCSSENQGSSQPTNNSSPSHRCLICSKSFSSGQALGGHMRCHASQLESSSSPRENNNNNSNCSRQQKVLDFDLNELPNDADDDHME